MVFPLMAHSQAFYSALRPAYQAAVELSAAGDVTAFEHGDGYSLGQSQPCRPGKDAVYYVAAGDGGYRSHRGGPGCLCTGRRPAGDGAAPDIAEGRHPRICR